MHRPGILVIGAGFTGVAVAYDLAQRGFAVTVLERGELASGTSGRTHGLLHSGARYCVDDKESAVECKEENRILRRIAAQCIEPNGGYFVGLTDDDVEYCQQFMAGAEECGIPITAIAIQDLLKKEPEINPDARCAYAVPDATFDSLRLAFAFAASAQKYGAKFLPYHEVEGLLSDQSSRVTGVAAWNRVDNSRLKIHAEMVINATGAWAGKITGMAGIDVPIRPTPGIMVAVEKRLTNTTINRLNKPGDGDIILPQRRMVVIGTTSFEITDVDYIPIEKEQIGMMVEMGSELVPAIRRTPIRGIYMSSRPLIGAEVDARSMARTFKAYDHEDTDGVGGLLSIIGGKATTCRAMAEITADIVCQKFSKVDECRTKDNVLESYRSYYRSN